MALMIMGKGTGHETVTYDAAKVAKGDKEALAAVQQAEEILQQALKKGGTAFAVDTATGETKLADKIDPRADTYVVLPLQGG